MLTNARGIQRDDAAAAHLFAAAAEQGVEQARNIVARMGEPRGAPPPCLRPPEEDRQLLAAMAEKAARTAAATGARPGVRRTGGTGGLSVDPPPPPNVPEPILRFVRLVAPEYGLRPALVLAVMATESNFNAAAVSPKNAQGLMQLMPGTAARFGVRDTLDPVQNMRGGMAYLRWLLATFQGDIALVAAAYNAGERAVERYLGVPPYAETRSYVLKVLAAAGGGIQHPFDPAAAPPSQQIALIRPPWRMVR
jgi:soluble lytic murein transglycosylase-like protein